MVYGLDLEELEFSRRYDQYSLPDVTVYCNNGKETISATSYGDTKVNANGRSGMHHVLAFPVKGYSTVAELQALADQKREEIGRANCEVRFKTKDLATLGGDNSDPDMLDLKPGTPIQVMVNREMRNGTTSARLQFESMSPQAKAVYLMRRGMEPGPAQTLARFLSDAKWSMAAQQTWYVQTAQHDFGPDEGWRGDVTAINYFWDPVAINRFWQDQTIQDERGVA